MKPSARLALAAFCTDFGLYLLMLSLPFRVLALGGGALQLGLVPVLYATPYSLVAATAGRLSDRWPRRRPIRVGLAFAVLGALSLARADDLPTLFASIPFIGVGLGFFWPSLQAGFSELHRGHRLLAMVSLFNVSWSAGKGGGMLLGSILLARMGPGFVSILAAAAYAMAAVVLPWMDRPRDHHLAVRADPRRPAPHRHRAFLHSAWIANGVGFGIVATVNHHLPQLAVRWGEGEREVGTLLAVVFLSQTLFFLQAGSRQWWHYRKGYLIAAQLLLVAAAGLLPQSPQIFLLVPLGAGLGIALGFAYQSSIYYSLDAPHSRGSQAGVHEAVLGVASATIPLVGGALVSPLGLRAPFLLAAICGSLAVIHTGLRLRSSDRGA